jgi:hypothetical protein
VLQQTFSTVIELVKTGTIDPSNGARMIAQMVNNIPGAGANKLAELASASMQPIMQPAMPQPAGAPRISGGGGVAGGAPSLPPGIDVATLQHALDQSAALPATPELQQLLLSSGMLDKLSRAGEAAPPAHAGAAPQQQPLGPLHPSPRQMNPSPRTHPVAGAPHGKYAQVDLEAEKQLWQVGAEVT